MLATIVMISCLLSGFYISKDIKNRNMNEIWWIFLGSFLGPIGVLLYINAKKPNRDQSEINNRTNNNNYSQRSINMVNLPDNCPHCKSPNTKRIRLCEWCGSQIC
jgi:hypothetical protein